VIVSKMTVRGQKNYSLFRVTGTVDLNSSDPQFKNVMHYTPDAQMYPPLGLRINDKNYRRFSALERCKVSINPQDFYREPHLSIFQIEKQE